MANPKVKTDLVSLEEYFDGEKASESKHEFVNGMVYAMSGGTIRHDRIKGNIAGALNASLPDTCSATTGDVQLGSIEGAAGQWFHYPDVFVTCGLQDDMDYRTDQAIVIFEVLSRTTERSDRYEKFDRAKTLATLQEYVLVEQLHPRIEVYRRRNSWKQEFLHPHHPLALESIKQTLTFAQIYRRVHFPSMSSLGGVNE